MTNCSLTSDERTRLSALLDNELPEAERESTLRLLAGSEEARRYLQHLQSLRTLTSSAGNAGSHRIVAASSVALTGPAIRSAALRSTSALGSSALTGWIAAAAFGIITVGGVLMLQQRESVADSTPGVTRPVESTSLATSAVEPIVSTAIDSAALVIPPLTRSDVLAFAVEGTLPIEPQRRRFMTISQTEGDSVKLTVHNRPPAAIRAEDLSEPAINSSLAVLDSLKDVVRSIMVKTPDGIALRADVPRLRAATITRIERVTPKLPPQVQQRVRQAEVDLAAYVRTYSNAPVPVIAFAPTTTTRYIAIATPESSSFLAFNSIDEEMATRDVTIIVNSREANLTFNGTGLLYHGAPVEEPAVALIEQGRQPLMTTVAASGGAPRIQRPVQRRVMKEGTELQNILESNAKAPSSLVPPAPPAPDTSYSTPSFYPLIFRNRYEISEDIPDTGSRALRERNRQLLRLHSNNGIPDASWRQWMENPRTREMFRRAEEELRLNHEDVLRRLRELERIDITVEDENTIRVQTSGKDIEIRMSDEKPTDD